MPAIQGLNKSLASSIKTCSGSRLTVPAIAGFAKKYGIANKPIPIAPPKQSTIQVILIRRALISDLTESAAIKRAKICGCPK